MKKNLLLTFILTFLFSGCFSFSSINPFSGEEKKEEIKQEKVEIPQNAPSWVAEPKEKGYVTSVGLATKIDKQEIHFHKQKALFNATHILIKDIYIKTFNLYKEYEEKLENPKTYDKDIKRFAEHISLKSATHSKILNSWFDLEKGLLFIKIGVDSEKVAELIQNNSKLLFDIDKKLYQNFLSNRAHKDITLLLEK